MKRASWQDWFSLAVVLAALVLPIAGLWHYQGPPMEEGHMLAFPAELLKGNVANRDFLHLYGPGSLWVLAGAFKIFGTALSTERSIGWLQHAVLAFGIFALVRPVGRWIASLCGTFAALIVITPLGLTAMAWNGAIAAGVWAVVLVTWSVTAAQAGEDRRARWLAAAGGVAGGVALLYRPDLIIAVVAAFVLVWLHSRPTERRPLAIGFVATSALILVQVAMAGVGNAFRGMFLQPVFDLRDGRSLPVPPSWSHVDGYFQQGGLLRTQGWALPQMAVPHQIVVWFWLSILVTIGLVVYVWWTRDARRGDGPPRLLALRAGALFGAGLVGQILQRPDSAHLAWVTCVTFPIAVAIVADEARRARPAWNDALVFAAVGLPVVLFLCVATPFFAVRSYVDVVTTGLRGEPFGYVVQRNGRAFYLADPQAARDAQRVVDALGARLERGQSLIESPSDLSRTVYSEAFFYYMFPELRAGTRYIEMDPGLTNTRGSGFAGEVRRADWLILTKRWGKWSEPNTSLDAGDPRPDRTVADHFCTVVDTPDYRLDKRCR